jgi:hypothetical protein
VVHGQERSAERQQRLAPLIEQLGKEYPEIKTLSEPVFLRWVAAAVALPEKSSVTIKGDTLDVLVRERDLPAVAANLYSFVRVNDVFAARCGCDARTNVGIAELGFPAYLFRLDSEERTSKILISIGNPDFGLTLPVPSVRRVTGAAYQKREGSLLAQRCKKGTSSNKSCSKASNRVGQSRCWA